MTYLKTLSFLLLFTFSITAISGQDILTPQIEQLAEKYVKKKKNHGLVIGIIQGEKSSIKGFGNLDKADPRVPDENTIFEVGSVTSVFTTTLMMLESQNGKFKLESRVQDFLPQDIEMPAFTPFICREIEDYSGTVTRQDYVKTHVVCEPVPFATEICINFCDLATHSSGLSNAPKGLYSWNPFKLVKQKKDPYKDYTITDLYKNLRKNDINQAPGIHYHFSNSGIALLGNVLASMNETTYEALLNNQLLRPLGMNQTRLILTEEQQLKLAPGHAKNGKLTNHWHFQAMAPAGGLKSSASDLVKFLDANLHTTDLTLENAFAEVHQGKLDVPKSHSKRPTLVAYGWHVSTLNEASNQPVVWINGGTGGFRTFLGFIKDTKTGIVVLSNSAQSVDDLAYEILELLMPPTRASKEVSD